MERKLNGEKLEAAAGLKCKSEDWWSGLMSIPGLVMFGEENVMIKPCEAMLTPPCLVPP